MKGNRCRDENVTTVIRERFCLTLDWASQSKSKSQRNYKCKLFALDIKETIIDWWSIWLRLKLSVIDIIFIGLSHYLHWLHFIRRMLVKRCSHSTSSGFLNGIFKSISHKWYVPSRRFSNLHIDQPSNEGKPHFLSANKRMKEVSQHESGVLKSCKNDVNIVTWHFPDLFSDDGLKRFCGSTVVKFSLKIHACGSANCSRMISKVPLFSNCSRSRLLNSMHVVGHVIGTLRDGKLNFFEI